MGIQVPLMINDRSLISVMTRVFLDCRRTHLRARWISETVSELSELPEKREEQTGKVLCWFDGRLEWSGRSSGAPGDEIICFIYLLNELIIKNILFIIKKCNGPYLWKKPITGNKGKRKKKKEMKGAPWALGPCGVRHPLSLLFFLFPFYFP